MPSLTGTHNTPGSFNAEFLSELDEQFFNSRAAQAQLPYLQRFALAERDSGYNLYQLSPPDCDLACYEDSSDCSANSQLS